MQKLFKNCYEMDKKCYQNYHLNEDILMEHAANAMYNYISTKFPKQSKVSIVAGPGNNGADGITLARLLHKEYKVKLFIPFGAKSQMAQIQLQRAKALGVKLTSKLKKGDIYIDALFGAGLNKELNKESIALISKLNEKKGFKIACDIPSGINEKGLPSPTAFKADITITMGALKEALYLDAAKDYVGKIKVANLGVARELYEDETNSFVLEKSDFQAPLRKKKSCHKGDFGHLAIFSGEKWGASIISATAASSFGVGLTTLIYHEKISHPPYLMSATTLAKNTTAIAIGMGLGEFFEYDFLEKEVINNTLPILLDADALYQKELLEILKQNREVVITPHPKEFSAVLEILDNKKLSVAEIQANRFTIAQEFSLKYKNTTLVLKGANTIIAKEGKLFINPLGSNILAKGGSGDILSGLIAALLAQGKDGLKAAVNGSLALALAAKRYKGANYSALPKDIIKQVKKLR
jgi:hydroxyethylthiazole kinase-like uncharacterized protein yjeF